MVGQYKDDRIQDHQHTVNSPSVGGGSLKLLTSTTGGEPIASWNTYASTIRSGYGRHGDTTRVKSKGVKFIIKVL